MKRAFIAFCVLRRAAAVQQMTMHRGMGDPDSEGNLCMMGHLAPEFFLLGAPKSGTTFFFEKFSLSSGIVNYIPGEDEPTWHAKETWFFGHQYDAAKKKSWLTHYPNCTHVERKVAVDCTPGYFSSPFAPFGIQKAYANIHHHNLVFMVFLRNPTDRAHSHYYQFKENGVLEGKFQLCRPHQFPTSFQAAVQKRIGPHKSLCDCGCDNIFEDSMYKFAFDRYFENFPPHTFHVVPFKQAITDELVRYTWQVLGVPEGSGPKKNIVGAGNEKNHHEYPSLAEDMPGSQLEEFTSWMDEMTGAQKLEKRLSGSGAHLCGFQEGGSIAEWLESNW